MIDTQLKNKVALVTGGNNPHGIGAAIAKTLASQGVAVFIHYFRQQNDFPSESTNSNKNDSPGLPVERWGDRRSEGRRRHNRRFWAARLLHQRPSRANVAPVFWR